MTTKLTVGGRAIPVEQARDIVIEYLTSEDHAFAYPSYDAYQTNDDPNQLCDGDLLAPVLLNVNVGIKTFADLRQHRAEIEGALAKVPDIDLADGDDETFAAIGAVAAILDSDHKPRGALLTTLAKVLHRKRPRTIPLYDELVRSIYQPSRVAIERGRSWQTFTTLLVREISDDLRAARETWNDLAALTPPGATPITPLRALDIVAWRAGRDGLGEAS